jgi:hypothetical protein
MPDSITDWVTFFSKPRWRGVRGVGLLLQMASFRRPRHRGACAAPPYGAVETVVVGAVIPRPPLPRASSDLVDKVHHT